MLTPEEVHLKAAQLQHTRWVVDECNGCNAKIGYIFNGDKIYYDSGCRCEGTPTPAVAVSWKTLASDINSRLEYGDQKEVQQVKEYWKI